MVSLYFIAGESSGDLLGARLIESLPQDASIHGVGGPLMEQAGLTSLFPMADIALMGLAEILPHIFKLKRRMRETVEDILLKNPDAVVTIDSPGFTFRIAKMLRKAGYTGKLIHYVAPSVWAYKPERAEKTAKLFDALMVIFPFEPPYFEEHGLPTCYVGHPIPWEWRDADATQPFAKNGYRLGMMAGSRKGEVEKHLPIFRETLERLKPHIEDLEVLLPVRPHLEEYVRQQTENWPVPTTLFMGEENKQAAFKSCDLILAKSGTVSVECAMAGVPTITTYRSNPITAWLIRRVIQIKYLNLINITANKLIIPELLQEDCNAEKLSEGILKLQQNPAEQEAQSFGREETLKILGKGSNNNPGKRAAEYVLSCLAV